MINIIYILIILHSREELLIVVIFLYYTSATIQVKLKVYCIVCSCSYGDICKEGTNEETKYFYQYIEKENKIITELIVCSSQWCNIKMFIRTQKLSQVVHRNIVWRYTQVQDVETWGYCVVVLMMAGTAMETCTLMQKIFVDLIYKLFVDIVSLALHSYAYTIYKPDQIDGCKILALTTTTV